MSKERELRRQKRLALIARRAKEREEGVQPQSPVNSVTETYTTPAAECPPEQSVGTDAANSPSIIVTKAPPIAPDDIPPAPEARLARVYAKPINPLLRLIELDDGSHGRLRVRMDAAPMIGWRVWVRPSCYTGDWEIHGRYNARGTRLQ